MHPILGISQLQHGQLNITSRHSAEMKEGINEQQATKGTDESTHIIHTQTPQTR